MSKSANYCYAGLSQNTGLVLLAEVAARPHYELCNAKYDADVDCKAKKALYVQIRVFDSNFLPDFGAYAIVPFGARCAGQPKVLAVSSRWIGKIVMKRWTMRP
jgi:hypothetical protein